MVAKLVITFYEKGNAMQFPILEAFWQIAIIFKICHFSKIGQQTLLLAEKTFPKSVIFLKKCRPPAVLLRIKILSTEAICSNKDKHVINHNKIYRRPGGYPHYGLTGGPVCLRAVRSAKDFQMAQFREITLPLGVFQLQYLQEVILTNF